jgi:hypothetical protein
MTRYRAVTRTGKYGSIKQHADIENIFYCTIAHNYENYYFTATSLEEGEKWIIQKRTELKSAPASSRKRKYNSTKR